MSFKILYVTATSSEAEVLNKIRGIINVPGGYRIGNLEINLLVAGVGSISTSWAMKQWISVNERPDLAINAGIAGSYREEFPIGDVLMPVTECFADAGIEDGNRFLTLFESGLVKVDEFPFRDGLLYADKRYSDLMKSRLKPVRAITVNTATGSEATRLKLSKKFSPDIETMEGATFFYICTRENIPFLALRSISNRVEPRDKSKWNIPLALDNLSEKLNEVIITLD
ncbi:MAG: futalosine hydrolase [Bacteroidetes bacterium]|nr:MAG: futalosine hydrolase [Bacteroidota bacterium]